MLLDTDIIIYALKVDLAVVENIKQLSTDPNAVYVTTYGDLILGAQCAQRVTENLAKGLRIKEIFQ